MLAIRCFARFPHASHPSIHVWLTICTSGAWVLLLSALLLPGEAFECRKAAAVLVCLLGVALVALGGWDSSHNAVVSMAAMLASTMLWALYEVQWTATLTSVLTFSYAWEYQACMHGEYQACISSALHYQPRAAGHDIRGKCVRLDSNVDIRSDHPQHWLE